jgi:hypothetical protein
MKELKQPRNNARVFHQAPTNNLATTKASKKSNIANNNHKS